MIHTHRRTQVQRSRGSKDREETDGSSCVSSYTTDGRTDGRRQTVALLSRRTRSWTVQTGWFFHTGSGAARHRTAPCGTASGVKAATRGAVPYGAVPCPIQCERTLRSTGSRSPASVRAGRYRQQSVLRRGSCSHGPRTGQPG